MSRQTTNYGLTKPDYTDTADIEVVNSNMDIIDEALKVIDTKAQNVMSKNSSAWSSTTTYTVGQYCIYNNSLWKCLVQHSGQTPQEGTYWTKVSLDTLGAEISAINSNLTNISAIQLVNGVIYEKRNGINLLYFNDYAITSTDGLLLPSDIITPPKNPVRVPISLFKSYTNMWTGCAVLATNSYTVQFRYCETYAGVIKTVPEGIGIRGQMIW